MEIRILHAADLHLDSPFQGLDRDKAAQRRREQRQLLQDLAELANRSEAQLILLAGDLFDSAVSYYETGEALAEFFAAVKGQVVIAPGNHDFYAPGSPWATLSFGENVHIFQTPAIRAFDFPALGCRVWGAGFTSSLCPALMSTFRVSAGAERIELGLIHGELGPGNHNPITPAEIAASGLDYLALGHVHSYSGILTAGKTAYAYPGCPEGRGFDECGEKGVILGTVSKGKTDLRFVPLGRRRYEILTAEVTGREPMEAVEEAAAKARPEDVVRIELRGEYPGEIDCARLQKALEPRFFQVSVRSRVTLPRDVWEGREENSLRGLFLDNLWKQYEAAGDEETRARVLQAVKYGLAALDQREEWMPT